jgi:hypothetical protein
VDVQAVSHRFSEASSSDSWQRFRVPPAERAPSPALLMMAMDRSRSEPRSGTIVVLCLPGTHGNNRFGPDPIPDRAPRQSSHPALVKEMDEELGRMVADRRKEEFQDYYRARVLPAIERQKAARRV